MHKIGTELSRVLVLHDRIGLRQSGHFDHDANASIGMPEAPAPHGRARAIRGAADATRTVGLGVKRDPETGELLST